MFIDIKRQIFREALMKSPGYTRGQWQNSTLPYFIKICIVIYTIIQHNSYTYKVTNRQTIISKNIQSVICTPFNLNNAAQVAEQVIIYCTKVINIIAGLVSKGTEIHKPITLSYNGQ